MGSSPLEPGTVVAGRYRIEGEIGQGGMGVVYRVRHVHTDETLALKILHAHHLREEQAVERFKREARAPARIQSEHVARVTDADTAADLEGKPFYVVMELLRGKDLEHVLLEQKALAPEIVVEYLRQAARALDKAHAIGIVHRDLKPENLFLTHREDGSACIKLLDFGIARLADVEAPSQLRTQAGFVFGTPTYMAPEQALGNVEAIGPTTDVWALGLVAFKLLMGRDFWQAQTVAQLYAMILSEPMPTASQRGAPFGPSFDAWFDQCVNRSIQARWQTAGDAVAALASALGVRLGTRSSVSLVAASEIEAPPAFTSTRLGVGADVARTFAPAVAPAQAPEVDEPLVVPMARPPAWRRPLAIGIAAVTTLIVAGSLTIGYRLAKQRTWGVVATAAPTSSPEATDAGLVETTGAADPPPSAAAAASTAAPAETAPGEPPPAPKTAGDAPRARATATAKPTSAPPKAATAPEAPPAERALTRDQRRRLGALQRLCDQGTFSASECKDKRAAILRDGS